MEGAGRGKRKDEKMCKRNSLLFPTLWGRSSYGGVSKNRLSCLAPGCRTLEGASFYVVVVEEWIGKGEEFLV